ncbi:hypothetical protein CP533_2919 [Ophiocordyceps camponoti-saundersi (nom. inval.)]|nr:hypothetical protein CP533_2919 [Ophiocordyceps camponoti-saundersi (nom. inval.)]
MTTIKRLALVTCSTRSRRLNPYMTSYVKETMTQHSVGIVLEIIDLAFQDLPIFDETVTPAQLPEEDPTPGYSREHSRAWSALVRQFDAFVFVTPQYNWSVPASLKNALDYLYHEWKAKPAAIVSYGGRGGGKAAAHLRDILTGLRMRTLPTAPGLTTASTMMASCERVGFVDEADRARWREEGVEEKIGLMTRELMEALAGS